MASTVEQLRIENMMKGAARSNLPAVRPYTPNFTIPDPRIEAQFQRASAEAAHGERVNPSPKAAPQFAPNDPRAYGDGRFGTPASQPTPSPAPRPLAAAAQTEKAPFYQRPLGDAVRGGASATGGLAKKAAGVLSAPAAVGIGGLTAAYNGFNTDTEQYAKRFGLENTEPGVLRDAGVRSLGLASDLGNAMTLGLAGNFFRDGQELANPLVKAAQAPMQKPAMPSTSTAGAGRGVVNPPSEPQASMVASNPLVRQISPGVFRQGNSYSDTAAGAAEGARPTPVSAQNMAAADALAQRYSNPLVQASQTPQNLTPADNGQGTGYGLLNSNRIAARNAMMDVQQLKPGSSKALAALLQQQTEAPKLQLEREQMAQQGANATADREMRGNELMAKIGESGADRALKSRELADNSLVNAAKREQMGLESGAAKRLASLQDAYLNAKTPEEQQTALSKLSALTGKGQADEYMAVGGGETVVDAANGVVTKNPDVLVNKRTGQPAQGKQAQKSTLPDGMVRQVGTSGGKPVYEDANGKRFMGG